MYNKTEGRPQTRKKQHKTPTFSVVSDGSLSYPSLMQADDNYEIIRKRYVKKVCVSGTITCIFQAEIN